MKKIFLLCVKGFLATEIVGAYSSLKKAKEQKKRLDSMRDNGPYWIGETFILETTLDSTKIIDEAENAIHRF